MNETGVNIAQENQQQIRFSRLPLAIYREVAAHLSQVTGVHVDLLPQTAQHFDYLQSQVGGVTICYSDAATAASRLRVAQILNYYGDRYGMWEAIEE